MTTAEAAGVTSTSEELLTPVEVRGILRISRQTLWRWANEGKLNPIRFGRTLRYRRSEIDTLIDVQDNR